MKITLHGHSCVSVATDEGVFVIDPGPASDLSVLASADAVLLTHAHPDHVDADTVIASQLPVWGPADAVGLIGQGTVVRPGESFSLLGTTINAVGGLHHEIHPRLPRPVNIGYFFNGVLHPGDQYIKGLHNVDVLLLPISAPWVKNSEAAAYARTVSATRTIPIHDGVLSDFGRKLYDNVMVKMKVPGYARLQQGTPLDLTQPLELDE
ncbi:MBL fold metallo-hydrolase [Corynebacterium sp. L4756]|uniref:MBL fold metallo-hydrolase n=1 Tax=unclassified Corynebacterium TaxID=2624378 RepID=UPI00374D2A36